MDTKAQLKAMDYPIPVTKEEWLVAADYAEELGNMELAEACRNAAAYVLRVGDIWYSSGGYDQTTINFYQISRVTKTMIVLEEIGVNIEETGFMSGRATPDLNAPETP